MKVFCQTLLVGLLCIINIICIRQTFSLLLFILVICVAVSAVTLKLLISENIRHHRGV